QGPCYLQFGDVAGVDLLKLAIAMIGVIARLGSPIAGIAHLLIEVWVRDSRGGSQRRSYRRGPDQHRSMTVSHVRLLGSASRSTATPMIAGKTSVAHRRCFT